MSQTVLGVGEFKTVLNSKLIDYTIINSTSIGNYGCILAHNIKGTILENFYFENVTSSAKFSGFKVSEGRNSLY